MLSIQKDLIPEIILNKDYDWSYVFKNPVIERPKGEIILIISVDYIKDVRSRVFIIKGKEDYHLMGQIQIDNYNEELLMDFEKLVEYNKTCKKSGTLNILDLDDPYYNSEWHFAITKPFWFSIMDKFKAITVPLYPLGTAHGNVTRTIWIKQNLNNLTLRWVGEDERYHDTKETMDYLSNIALAKIDTAYYLNK